MSKTTPTRPARAENVGSRIEYTRTWLVVQGTDEFPLHMLTLEECFPAMKEDAAALMGSRALRRIVLQRHSEDGLPPKLEQWASHLWAVVGSFHAYAPAQQCAKGVPEMKKAAHL